MPKLILDYTTEYARQVLAGEIKTGEPVALACQRHLDDLAAGRYFFSRRLANRAFEFFERYLVLHTGEYEGAPFKLLPWQKFIVGSIFGWLEKAPGGALPRGRRRFRTAYVETGKGSGKSPLAAGMGIYCTYADGESRSEAYYLARTKEQALIPFRITVNMVESNEELDDISKTYGGANPHRVVILDKQSFITRIASAKAGEGHSGPNAHFVLCDEYHEQASSAMLDIYEASTKQRRQALVVIITNAGIAKTSPCGQKHDRGQKIVRKAIKDNTTFVYICQLDDKDNPWQDESCWIKTNPSLPAVPGYRYIREQVESARGLASSVATVDRLNFCRWTDAEAPWLSPEIWQACQVDQLTDVKFRKQWRKAMAVDLSLKTDFTAVAEVWESPDGIYEAKVSIYTPHATVREKAERDAAPYMDWVNEGHLITIPGAVIGYREIAENIYDPYWQSDKCIGLAFDGWNIEFLQQGMDDAGIPYYKAGRDAEKIRAIKMIPHGQGFTTGSYAREQGREYLAMPHSINVLEECLHDRKIRVKLNPCLTMMAMNAVVRTDMVENRRFDKKAANRRIDGLVALTMAVGLLDMRTIAKTTSPWDNEDYRHTR